MTCPEVLGKLDFTDQVFKGQDCVKFILCSAQYLNMFVFLAFMTASVNLRCLLAC